MSVPASSSRAEGVINIPAFITKLWMLVDDKDTDKLIKWSQDGNSFIVYDSGQFAKDVLPKVFKHNNMPSFVRQLNMYGFRKKMQPEQGGLIRTPESNQIEFYHPHFVKGNPKQLQLIKRKISNKDDLRLQSEGVSSILKDVEQMKSKQDGITGKLDNMQRENEALWREVMILRRRHEQQQKIVSRLIQFLLTLAQQKNPLKRTQLPMIQAGLDAPSKSKYSKVDEFLQSDPEILSEPLVTSGATLSEVEDLPPEILGPASSSDLPVTDDLDLPMYREEVPASLALGEIIDQPVITSPGGHQINSPAQEDSTEVTGQILPVSNPTASPVLMPQVTHDQQSISRPPALQRVLSVEEQKQEIGEQVTGIQNNLEFIQNLLEASPRLNVENLWEIFRTDEVGNSHDFLSTLADSNGLNIPNTSNITGTELVQYQPTNLENTLPSTIFSEEDENLLLTSLDEDARNLVPSEGSKEDEGAAT